MRPVATTIPGGSFRSHFAAFEGLYTDEFAPDSVWLRDCARIQLPPMEGQRRLVLRGEYRIHPQARGLECTLPACTAGSMASR